MFATGHKNGTISIWEISVIDKTLIVKKEFKVSSLPITSLCVVSNGSGIVALDSSGNPTLLSTPIVFGYENRNHNYSSRILVPNDLFVKCSICGESTLMIRGSVCQCCCRVMCIKCIKKGLCTVCQSLKAKTYEKLTSNFENQESEEPTKENIKENSTQQVSEEKISTSTTESSFNEIQTEKNEDDDNEHDSNDYYQDIEPESISSSSSCDEEKDKETKKGNKLISTLKFFKRSGKSDEGNNDDQESNVSFESEDSDDSI